MAFRKKAKQTKLSVPVDDEAEARWRREDFVAYETPTPWGESEGELSVDVYYTDSAVVVRSPMAGVSPEDVHIALHNDLLTIRGERREEERVLADRYAVRECHWGAFSRSVVLPVSVSSDGAEATLKNGVLKIVLKRIQPGTVEFGVTGED